MPSRRRANAWLNTHPLSAAELRGKVVLVDFWTYICINWLRTLPYVRAWAEKYAEGRIRQHHFGEGEYERAEQIIQELPIEAGHKDFDRTLVSVEGRGAEAAPDRRNLRSPETYIGRAYGERFVSKDAGSLKVNQWTLVGDWSRRSESAMLRDREPRVSLARDLHLVMGPATRGTPVRFRVRIDGQPLGESHGVDVDASGDGTIGSPRMYQLIRQTGPISDRTHDDSTGAG